MVQRTRVALTAAAGILVIMNAFTIMLQNSADDFQVVPLADYIKRSPQYLDPKDWQQLEGRYSFCAFYYSRD